MGQSQSQAVINSINESVNTFASNVIQSCTTVDDQSQTVNLNNAGLQFGSSTNITQQTTVDFKCAQNSNIESQIQNELLNIIANTSTASQPAGFLLPAFGSTTATATSNLQNIIKNNVTMTNINNQYNMIKQNQTVNVSNSGVQLGSTLNISQGSSVFGAATQTVVDQSGILNTIKNHVDNTANTTSSMDVLANMIEYIVIAIIILAIAGVFIYRSVSTTSTTTGNSTPAAPAVAEPSMFSL